MENTIDAVLHFWFQELKPKQWYIKDPILDADMKKRFLSLHTAANRCELFSWRNSTEGRLAEILVLDQFSRNIFRNQVESFASDSLALTLAQECLSLRLDQKLNPVQKSFIYMPYMHSESALIHQEAFRIFSQPGLEENLDYEIQHKKIIDRFGRYPHRNKILGRASTQEEIEFLLQPNSSF